MKNKSITKEKKRNSVSLKKLLQIKNIVIKYVVIFFFVDMRHNRTILNNIHKIYIQK